MKNVILIHGYNGIPKIYEYFMKKLKDRKYNLIVPNFPTKTDITMNAYFKIFDENKEYFTEDCIVIAHSIGNEMFVKYICQNIRMPCWSIPCGRGIWTDEAPHCRNLSGHSRSPDGCCASIPAVTPVRKI